MKKWLSYYKIHTIVRVAKFNKNAMRRETTLEKTLIFTLKSKENRRKNREKRHAPQKSSKNCSRAHLFEQKYDFFSILGSWLVPKIHQKRDAKNDRKNSSRSPLHREWTSLHMDNKKPSIRQDI